MIIIYAQLLPYIQRKSFTYFPFSSGMMNPVVSGFADVPPQK